MKNLSMRSCQTRRILSIGLAVTTQLLLMTNALHRQEYWRPNLKPTLRSSFIPSVIFPARDGQQSYAFRGGAEQKIRKYLVDNNFVETVISLAPNLFYGTSIAVNIMVLSKHKTNTKIQFIDASGEDFYKKETNNNILTDEHIEKIMQLFASKEDKEYVSASVDKDEIAKENYNLSVSSYVEAKDTREVIDIDALNAEIKKTVKNIDRLRCETDKIIAEIEG